MNQVDPETTAPPGREGLIEALTALIDALDQRVPHFERAGEHQIAVDAAALRVEAVKRLAELKRSEFV